MKLKLFYLFIGLIGLSTLCACNDDDDNTVTTPNVPEAIANAFKAKYPDVDSRNVKWEQKGNYMVAEFKKTANMEEVDAWFSATGEWKMSETDYGKNLFLLPTEINDALRDNGYLSWTMDDINYYEYTDASKNFYLFEMTKAGEPETNAFFKADGTKIKTTIGDQADITPDTVI